MASVSNTSKLLENVQQICDQKFSKKQAELVKQFSQLIYSSVSEYEFSERTAEEYFDSISSLWGFIQDFDGSSKVRVFNPDLKKDGWWVVEKKSYVEVRPGEHSYSNLKRYVQVVVYILQKAQEQQKCIMEYDSQNDTLIEECMKF